MTDILEETKVGDKLCMLERRVGLAPDVLRQVTVTKVTPKRVTAVRNGHKYTFDRQGRERPSPRYTMGLTACPMTPELKDQITRQACVLRARAVVRDLASKAITDDQAIAIASAILKALEGAE